VLQVNNSGSTALTQVNLEALFTAPAYANLQAILGGNFIKTDSSGASLPAYASDPAGLSNGDIWFDSTTGEIKYKNASGVQTVGASSGGSGVSSLTVGSSMSINGTVAGTISSAGTIDLTNTGVSAGTYTKVTVDAKGRVIAGTISLVEGDIPNLTVAGKVSGNTITSGTISGSADINTTGNLITTGTVSGLNVQATNLRVYNGTNYLQIAAPALSGNVNLTLPTTDGNPNEFLKTDGNGVLSWAAATITSSDVTGALGYTPLNAAATFAGDASGVYSNISVDKIKGKAVTAGSVSGQMMIYDGTAWMNSVVSGDATLAYDGILTLNKVPVSKGGTNATTFGNNRIIASNGTGTALQDFTCSLNQVISFDASGNATCAAVSSLGGFILNGGNTTGADISIGTNDNKALAFKVNNSTAMTISQSGYVGIGTTTPSQPLTVEKSINGAAEVRLTNTNSGTSSYAVFTAHNDMDYAAMFGVGGWGATGLGALYQNRAFIDAPMTLSGISLVTQGASPIVFATNATERMRVSLSGNVGIGTSNPTTALDISGAMTANGMSSAPAVSASRTGRIYYDYSANKFKVSQNGAAYVDLVASGGITSVGGQSGASQTLAISVDNSVATPTITSASDTHTWKIPMASNSGTTAGLLNKTDYDSFVAKLGTTTQFAGDVSGTYNATIVQKIQGKAITAGSVSGQMMIYNGTAWNNAVMSGDATMDYAGALTLARVPVSKGGTNAAGFGNNHIIASNGTGSALVDFVCSLNYVISFDASGNAVCANVSSLSAGILNGGNTTGADISIGTNDNKALAFKVNNTTAMTISQGGNVGIGTTSPGSPLDVTGNANVSGTMYIGSLSSASGALVISSGLYGYTGGTTGSNIMSLTGNWLTTGKILNLASSSNSMTGTLLSSVYSGSGSGKNVVISTSNASASGDTLTVSNSGTGNTVVFTSGSSNTVIASGGNVGIGTSTPSSALDISGAMTANGMSSAPSVSSSNTGRIYYDYSANKFKVSQNGAAYSDLVVSASSITSINGASAAQGGDALVTGGTSTTSANPGGQVIITGGTPGATGVGGGASLLGGPGGSTSGNGGAVTITGGVPTAGAGGDVNISGAAGVGSSKAGGAVSITGGAGSATGGVGGAITLTAGTGTSLGAAGSVTIKAGSGANGGGLGTVLIQGSDGAGSTAGPVNIKGGTAGAAGTSVGGLVTVQGGAASGTGGSAGGGVSILGSAGNAGAGGAITITSGGGGNAGFGTGLAAGSVAISAAAGGTGTAGWAGGPGAAVSITSGAGGAGGAGSNGGAGGGLTLTAGAAGATGNANGGDVTLNGGAKTGTGTDGNVILANTRGRVGIGTSSPAFPLEVRNELMVTNGTVHIDLDGATGAIYSDQGLWNYTSGNNSKVLTQTTGTSITRNIADANPALIIQQTHASSTGDILQIKNNSSTVAAITQTGNFGIGTGSPSARLDVTDAGTTTSAIIVPRAGNFTGTAVNGMVRYNSTSNLFEFYQNGAWTNYTTVSDGRLKTNVVPIGDALGLVNRLNPVYFDWDRSNPRTQSFEQKHQVGFIAQEVETVLPEVVNQGRDSFRSVEYGKLVSVAIGAIKELYQNWLSDHAELEKLKQENAQIKAYLCAKDPSAPMCNSH
jgi:hypothetical protein